MLPIDRRNIIIEYLQEHGSARVQDLALKLGVTPMTIRRDLQYLEDNQVVSKIYGGAILKSGLTGEVPYKNKSVRHKDQKKRIAKYAASLVKDGQIVFLDAGTTNIEIGKLLKDKHNLTIVTTDIKIAAFLAFSTNFKVLSAGGLVQNSTGTCLGSDTVKFLEKINVDISFIGTSSVTVENGISTPTFEKADVKKQGIKSAKRSILVTDSSKFGKESFTKVCSLDDFDLIVSDLDLDKEVYEMLKKQDINIELV